MVAERPSDWEIQSTSTLAPLAWQMTFAFGGKVVVKAVSCAFPSTHSPWAPSNLKSPDSPHSFRGPDRQVMAKCSAAAVALDGIKDKPWSLVNGIIRRYVNCRSRRVVARLGADFRGTDEHGNPLARHGRLRTVRLIEINGLEKAALL